MLSDADREALFKAGDHHPDHCDCSAYIIEQAFAEDECCSGLWETFIVAEAVIARHVAEAKAEVIDAIEETFLGQLPSAAIGLCAQEDVNAGLDALSERFGLEGGDR